jgi:hypothetical protein
MRAFQPHNDWRDRRWTYSNMNWRGGDWNGPYPRARARSTGHPAPILRSVATLVTVLCVLFLAEVIRILLTLLLSA